MRVPGDIFRAYDVRGVVGAQLSAGLYYHLGRAYATMVQRQGGGVVYSGYDGRISSPELAAALNSGMQASGAEVVNLGCVPTPMVYFAALQDQGTGVMVTGSHNPKDYNGCKMMINGHTLETDWIQNLRGLIEAEDYHQGAGSISERDIFPQYRQAFCERVRLERRLKVVIDAGNGVAGGIAPAIFRALGCEVTELYCDIDGNFPNHHPDPGQPKNMVQLQRIVLENDADLGIGFDGDADRVGIVDNLGRLIYPDQVLMLLAEDALARHAGGVVIFDVKCSRHLGAVISASGGQPVMTQTGHSLIKKQIKQQGALIAGEMSGHLFVCEGWNGSDDAMLAAGAVAAALAKQAYSLAELFDRYPQSVSTPEINITVPEADKFAIVERLRAEGDFGVDASLITIDGVRVEWERGWGLIRASNTTPTLVVRIEADDAAELEAIRALLERELRKVAPDCRIPI